MQRCGDARIIPVLDFTGAGGKCMNNGVRFYMARTIGLGELLLIPIMATALDTTATVITAKGPVRVVSS
jgi:hypothetical protein